MCRPDTRDLFSFAKDNATERTTMCSVRSPVPGRLWFSLGSLSSDEAPFFYGAATDGMCGTGFLGPHRAPNHECVVTNIRCAATTMKRICTATVFLSKHIISGYPYRTGANPHQPLENACIGHGKKPPIDAHGIRMPFPHGTSSVAISSGPQNFKRVFISGQDNSYGGVLWKGFRPFLFSCNTDEWHP
mmetsp:Transcript_22438/g.47405  ORF Transcript_22438/g.47405 Transcript_22438/m.47405 type:complete len:188 (+) Transcript_22438:3312-3875(+)